MAEKNLIIAELRNRGFHIEEITVVKNGIEFDSITIGTGTVRPNIYVDFLERFDDVSEAADKVVEIVNNAEIPNVDYFEFFDKEYLKKNLRIAVQRAGTQSLVKRDTEFPGIEQYLYIQADFDKNGMASINLKTEHLKMIDADIDELWNVALENTIAEAQKPMSVLQKLAQIGCIDDDFESDGFPMQVLTNKANLKGASQILNTELLKSVAEIMGTNEIYIIPSSIHEILVVPTDGFSLEDVTEMVRETNANEVDPVEQLSDMAYYKAF